MRSHLYAASYRGTRGVSNRKSIDVRRISPGAILAKGMRGVQILKTRLLRQTNVLLVKIALRPAKVLGHASHVLQQTRPRLSQLLGHQSVLLRRLGAFVPTRVGMGMRVKLKHATLDHGVNLAPAQDDAVAFTLLDSTFTLVMVGRLRHPCLSPHRANGTILDPGCHQKHDCLVTVLLE